MEWQAPALVLDSRPYGEADAVATVLTEAFGVHRGLVRGGQSRTRVATWQPGTLVSARWTGRLPEQLGQLTAEPVFQTMAYLLDDPLALAMLSAICAVAQGALPERASHPALFGALITLVTALPRGGAEALPDYVRWELRLLSELGYGLDLSACTVTGVTAGLAYVSPRTGRAVSEAGAEQWRDRLLPLPSFLVGGNRTDLDACRDGLRLTGHFLARDAFGHHHRPLPNARLLLFDRIEAMREAALAAEHTSSPG